jgi:prepilin-type processing-associated H-X9-DG protein
MAFLCPNCGMSMGTAYEMVGQTAYCAHCGKVVDEPTVVGETPKRSGCSGLSCGVLFLLLFIGIDIFGVLLAQLLPAMQAAREASRRGQCVQNLQQIGAAMQAYQQRYGSFPPAFVADPAGKPMHSWRVLLLPFLKERGLYAEYRFNEPWNSPHNMTLAERMPHVYHCPTNGPGDLSQTSYAMIVGPRAISDGAGTHRLKDVANRGTGTVMVTEAANTGINWLEPRDLNVKDMTFVRNVAEQPPPGSGKDIASQHANMVNALFCDGEVREIPSSTDEKALKAMLSIDGGKSVPPR